MTGPVPAIEQFLYHEAQLLDERRFEDWLALYDPDAWYWAPLDPAETERKRSLALIDDNHPELELRIRRLREPSAHTEYPAPLATRAVSNVVLVDAGSLTVRSKLLMHEFRRREVGVDDYRTFSATVRHGLRRDGDGFRIRWKRVDLIDAAGARRLMPTPL
jgi:benzoate/toluate 1,2-dioxygenase beta subunit